MKNMFRYLLPCLVACLVTTLIAAEPKVLPESNSTPKITTAITPVRVGIFIRSSSEAVDTQVRALLVNELRRQQIGVVTESPNFVIEVLITQRSHTLALSTLIYQTEAFDNLQQYLNSVQATGYATWLKAQPLVQLKDRSVYITSLSESDLSAIISTTVKNLQTHIFKFYENPSK